MKAYDLNNLVLGAMQSKRTKTENVDTIQISHFYLFIQLIQLFSFINVAFSILKLLWIGDILLFTLVLGSVY